MSDSITIKNIDYEILSRLNGEAKNRGISVNMLVLQFISEAIGLDYKVPQYKPSDDSDISTDSWFNNLKINSLINYKLAQDIEIVIEPDDDGFIARNPDLPLYGFGDSSGEALNALKYEIESLYDDLHEDDNFTSDWFKIKSFLQKIIIDNEK